MSKRSSSSKLFFYDLHGLGVKVQVMADARYLITLIILLYLYPFLAKGLYVFICLNKHSSGVFNLAIVLIRIII